MTGRTPAGMDVVVSGDVISLEGRGGGDSGIGEVPGEGFPGPVPPANQITSRRKEFTEGELERRKSRAAKLRR